MSAAAGLHAPVNGLPRHIVGVAEASEYEKILNIYGQVIGGTHPRLRLSGPLEPAVREGSTAQHPPPPQGGVAATTIPPLVANAQPQGPLIRNNPPNLPAKQANVNGSSHFTQAVLSKPPASGIDPIFLTKSDHLVRAETQLQRQNAERLLREQIDHRRLDARHKPSAAEAKPDFDVTDILARALTIVKPVVLDESRGIHDNGSATDSFDENSFYSSKAPDSIPRDGDGSFKSSLSKHHVQPADDDEPDADQLVDRRSEECQQVDHPDSPYRETLRPELSVPLDPRFRQDSQHGRELGAGSGPVPLEEGEEEDYEPEYSPPEPIQPTLWQNGWSTTGVDLSTDHGNYVSRGHGQHLQDFRRNPSTIDADVRIVRSQIQSPLAPQPSRVSPLAVAKDAPISQNHHHRPEYVQQRRRGDIDSERTSPDLGASINQPRKRRKVREIPKPIRKMASEPLNPVIKDEPVSPPPFHVVPPLGAARNRQAAARPIYIDDDPPQELRQAPERRAEVAPKQVVYDVPEQAPHSVTRLLSRNGLRDAGRDNSDLRRVVSLQTLSARENMEPAYSTPTRWSRAPSAAGGSAFRYQEDRLVEGQPSPYGRSQFLDEAPPSGMAYRDREPEYQYGMQPIAPPVQRRIVVDEYGQRFYESIPTPRTPIAQSTVRRIDIDAYNEAVTARNGATRASSVYEEPYGESRYGSDMPPPQRVYRRVSETTRPVTADVRYVAEAPQPSSADVRYVTREAIEARPLHSSGSVQVYDYPTRQSNLVHDDAPSREPLMRLSSSRAAARPYDNHKEIYQPERSTRPETHEVRVFPEERSQMGRDVVQVERPRYEVRPSAEGDRYYRIDDRGRMVFEGEDEARPVYASRY